jgi:hypothetical protein
LLAKDRRLGWPLNACRMGGSFIILVNYVTQKSWLNIERGPFRVGANARKL